jgi:predicted lipoprotein with Yx(FWY)xxD motif
MHLRTRTRTAGLLASAALVLALATACGSSGSAATTPPPSTAAAGGGTGSPAASTPALVVTSNQSLGRIVTTGAGLTVYRFDADSANPSKSNCTGGCATAWPPVLYTGSGTPTVSGVNQSLVGVITRPDGGRQLTLAGWPLYTYAGDSGPGSIGGQGSGGTWWAVTPTGAKAGSSAGTPSAAASTSASKGVGYGY